MSEKRNPNPNGRKGEPIVVPEMDLDAALRKILQSPMPPDDSRIGRKKTAKPKK